MERTSYEEMFGPYFSAYVVSSYEAAIKKDNSSAYEMNATIHKTWQGK